MIGRVPYPAQALSVPLSDTTDVDRWTQPTEVQLLIWLAGKTRGDILEVGCRSGRTTFELARSFPDRTVWACDWTGAGQTMLPQQRHEVVDQPCHLARSLANVRVINQDSKTLDYSSMPEVQFVYIDCDHSLAGVSRDTRLALDHLESTGKFGIVVWHDVNEDRPSWCKVLEYLTILSQSRTIVRVSDTSMAVYLVNVELSVAIGA